MGKRQRLSLGNGSNAAPVSDVRTGLELNILQQVDAWYDAKAVENRAHAHMQASGHTDINGEEDFQEPEDDTVYDEQPLPEGKFHQEAREHFSG